jgi:hypothetical protein
MPAPPSSFSGADHGHYLRATGGGSLTNAYISMKHVTNIIQKKLLTTNMVCKKEITKKIFLHNLLYTTLLEYDINI